MAITLHRPAQVRGIDGGRESPAIFVQADREKIDRPPGKFLGRPL